MKVAIIGSRGAHSNYGGIEKVLGQIAPRLTKLGHSVDVFCSRPGDLPRESAQCVRSIHVPALRGKYTETLSRSLVGTALALAKGYDVINLVAVGPGILSVLPHLAGVPVVVSIHGLDWRRDKWPGPARAALRLAERTIVSQADEITVVSRQLQQYFYDTYRRSTIYTPNGVEVQTSQWDAAILASFGLSAGSFVLFASRLVPEKGAHELVAAFNRLRTDKTLVIAGGSHYDQSYVDRLKAADTTGRCVFTGHLTGAVLNTLFQGAYLYTLPSHVEGLSMSLLEAMGFGKATLVSDIPENVEVIGDCGFRFPVGSIDALAAGLQRLLDDPDSVAAMGLMARTRAHHLYSWDSVAEQYSGVYERIGGRRAKSSRLGPLSRPQM